VLVDEEAEALHDIDDHIEKALHWNFSDNLYDLFIGTIGKGMYYLERLEFARQQQDHPTISELQRRLEAIVENLDHSAITHPDGVYWLDHYTSGHETHRPGHPYVGIGLSHGLPSIIYFLGRCYLLGIAGNTCLELIRRATDWLLQRESSPGHFPTKWYPDGEVDDSHDLSWCYGVFSAATAFYIAGKLLDDPVKTNKVATIIDHAAALSLTEYRVHESEGLKNIFFCHGTAGISYLFGKMHRLFGKSSWKTAADRWMAETRSVLRQYPQAKLRQHQRALLDGLAGVHLVLMAGEQEKPDTGWDRLFLLDLEQFA
ncbi:MAG: hypothetical protein KDD15_12530, partial [Lewinella sp.]|nr:hypothetical protein [Lewinella sp.]